MVNYLATHSALHLKTLTVACSDVRLDASWACLVWLWAATLEYLWETTMVMTMPSLKAAEKVKTMEDRLASM